MIHNPTTELALLGAMMSNADSLADVAGFTKQQDFYIPRNAKIFKNIVKLYEKTGRADVVSVAAECKGIELTYLMDCVAQAPIGGDALNYAQNLRNDRIKRDLLSLGTLTKENTETGMDASEILDVFENKVLELRSGATLNQIMELSDASELLMTEIEAGRDFRGVPTGLKGLDTLIGGFANQDFIILGARPSMGKTAVVLKIAHGMAKAGVPVGFFSIEMSREQIVARLMAIDSQVNIASIRSGKMTFEEKRELIQSNENFKGYKFFIDNSPAPSVLQIKATARKMKRQGVQAIFIDYAQLIVPRSGDSTQQQFSDISKELKRMAKELDMPIIVLSQLSRKVEERGDKEPILSDLRETGAWEQDADIVMFIHRYDYQTNDAAIDLQGKAALLIRKHRNGPIGKVDLQFISTTATFVEPTLI